MWLVDPKGFLAAASPVLLFGRVQPLDHRLALPWLQSRLLALGRGCGDHLVDLGQDLGERQLDIASIQSRRFHEHQVVLLCKGLSHYFENNKNFNFSTTPLAHTCTHILFLSLFSCLPGHPLSPQRASASDPTCCR